MLIFNILPYIKSLIREKFTVADISFAVSHYFIFFLIPHPVILRQNAKSVEKNSTKGQFLVFILPYIIPCGLFRNEV